MEIMDEVEFQDWPGGPSPESVEINSGNNPWMPAYGFQTPSALLEKEDFIGNPDAEYFLSAPATQQYMYLETIQEETSDDMRSDSDDVDEFRNSPMGWLATDSEDGSVICIEQIEDSESDREIACPPKRRKQDFVLNLPDAYFDENSSLSRSSSLLQFETLEKECQQESLSPSVFSQFTFDALQISDESEEFGVNDYSTKGTIFSDFAREIERSKQSASRDSLLYNVSTRYSSSSDSSSDSDTTVENFRSCDNLKTWRSFDNLLLSNGNSKKFSSENLSEDSGYGDQIFNYGKSVNLSNSVGNLASNKLNHRKKMSSRISETNNNNYSPKEKKNSYVGFNAYDCDVFQNFNSNFGVSYQDLSIFNRYDPFSEPPSKIADETFLRKKQILQLLRSPSRNSTGQSNYLSTNLNNVNLDCESISYSKSSKISDCCTVSHAVSAPNLHHSTEKSSVDIQNSTLNVSSVPKDLNFLGGEFLHSSPYSTTIVTSSVAEKNLNLADLDFKLSVIVGNNHQDSSASSSLKLKLHLVEDNKEDAKSLVEPNNNSKIMANYKREGSYSEAMSNRVDLSDDENSLRYKKKLPKSPIVDFDRRVLKAISEQSLQSLTLTQSTTSLHEAQNYHLSKSITTFEPPNIDFTSSTPKNTKNKTVAQSTPNLNRIEPVVKREKDLYFDEDRRKSTLEIASCSKYDTDKIEEERGKNILLDCSTDECEGEVIVMRKGSIIKSSTSTSGMSDIDDKTLRHSVKSFSGSNGSKGVHFSPVVAEVNWRDDASTSTVTPDRDSLYSLNSSSPEPENRKSSKMKVIKPKAQYPVHTQARRSVSHPDISDTDSKNYKKEFVESLNNLRGQNQDMSKSQPDVSKLKRRGSQMIKIDPDGSTVKAYVDIDGVQYKHTHLDVNSLSQTSLNGSNSAINSKSNNMMGIPSFASRNSNTSKFPYYEVASSHGGLGDVVEENVQQLSEANKQFKNVEAMNDPRTTTINNKSAVFPKQRKNKSGLGGFLQRLASFRLGAKKGHEKLKRKVETGNDTSINKGQATNLNFISTEKPSYIYIPLKGPSSTTTSAAAGLDNNNIDGSTVVVSSGKPPLPKQPPPRVVHASVKKAAHAPQNGGGLLDERRRRRTIDSANGAVDIIRNSGLYGNGKVSMDGPMGLIETDLDTEVTVITNGSNPKARSLLNLGHHDEPRLRVPENSDGSQNSAGRPHKSMEFLLDKQNLKVVEPPENELQKTERVMSEHELRVQRSLQKLTVPEWYKNSQIPGQGFILKNKNNQQQRETRWKGTTGAGTSSKTTSLSSLGGAQSPLLVLSPTPTSSSQSFVRWSTSKLNSTASSPCQSTRSSFNQGRVQQQPINGSISPSSARSSFNYRQPYLGWRSQERLSRPRTPAERLASSILSKQQNSSPASSSPSTHHNLQQQQESPEIQTSIKEVTSAIVHYVSALRPTDGLDNYQDNLSQRSSSVSPRGSQKLCWLESSFVGTKQLDSPETPVTCSESPVPPTAASSQTLRLDLQNHHHSSNNGKSSLRA